MYIYIYIYIYIYVYTRTQPHTSNPQLSTSNPELRTLNKIGGESAVVLPALRPPPPRLPRPCRSHLGSTR